MLSLYDLTGIQRYIFGSNVLKENLGGSFLAKEALETWLQQIAQEEGAKWVWAGGGNAMVKAGSAPAALAVATRLSRMLHEKAPGLHVSCAHVEWDGATDTFRPAYTKAQSLVQQHKLGRWPAADFDGGGVTALCATTGEPAVSWDEDKKKWIGPVSKARLEASDEARQDLAGHFDLQPYRVKENNLVWTDEIDRLGRSRGARSLVGVIHFDGNGMGERFRAASDSRESLRTLSEAVKEAGRQTLKESLRWVASRLPGITDPDRGGFELHPPDDKGRDGPRCFPVRPIVYGGDDITLVCEGRIALDLAAELLRQWNRATRELPPQEAHACAGVALVHAHYPFYRACGLAEGRCHTAKEKLRETGQDSSASCLDWELVAGAGLAAEDGDDGDERCATGERLHAGPYYVLGDPPSTEPYRDWKWFRETLVGALQAQDERRTRFKALARVLREGPKATGVELARWRDRFGLDRSDRDPREHKAIDGGLWLPEAAGYALRDGFGAEETPYLDAIELMDRVLPAACYDKEEGDPATGAGGGA
jgi:hypothetical protein